MRKAVGDGSGVKQISVVELAAELAVGGLALFDPPPREAAEAAEQLVLLRRPGGRSGGDEQLIARIRVSICSPVYIARSVSAG